MNQYSLVFFLNSVEILGIILFLKVYLSQSDKKESLIFDPLLFFVLGSSFVYLFVPFLMYIFGWSWHHVVLSESSYIKANIYVYSYIFMTLFTYMFMLESFRTKRTVSKPTKHKIFYSLSQKQNTILILLFLVPVLLDTLYLLRYIFSFDFAYYLANRIILRKGMGLIILISYMGTLIVPIFFANILVKVRHKNRVKFLVAMLLFSGVILLPFLSAYVVMGNRLTALILLVMLIMIYVVVMEKKFTAFFYAKLTFGFVGLFLFFAFLGYMRAVQGDFAKADFSLLLELIGNEAEHAFVGNFGNFEHLVWLFDHDEAWEPLYGETFVAGFFNLVPRFIWPDKLLGGGPNLKNIIHPGSYDLGGENITSYTTGMAVEGYMNFDIFGVIVLSLFHAFALLLLKKISYKINGNIVLLSLYLYLTFSVTFLMIFGEFLGIYTRTLVVSMPFVIFYLLSKKPQFTGRYR